MSSDVYWVNGPWPGKLAVAARPRGGDWLEDEIYQWRRFGFDAILSLLTAEEERDLNLVQERTEARKQGLKFLSLPIPDRDVPQSETNLNETLRQTGSVLSSGKNLLIHCRQGIGRSGLIAACLLIRAGMSPGAAVEVISSARGVTVPETNEQRDWIERFAPAITK